MDEDASYVYERRVDPELAGAFAKDRDREEFLERLNGWLVFHADAEYLELEETQPTLHVIGAPRSGTTLLHQALVSRLELGYVDNLVAAFWRAPTYGIELSRALGVGQRASSFESSYGRTRALGEPHEFGYFWNDHLRYPDLAEREPGHQDTIDWRYLRRILLNMGHAAGAPFAFKPMLLVWHIDTMLREMPLSCYAWIRREPRQVALSLLKMREAVFGSVEYWASLKPREAVALGGSDPVRQVAAQVLVLERTLERAAQRLGPDHLVEVAHDELCEQPDEVVSRVRALLASKGADVAERGGPLEPFERQRNDELEAEYGARVDAALESVGVALAGAAA